MFHFSFNKSNRINPKLNDKNKEQEEIKTSEKSSEFLKLLEDSNFKTAKEFLNNNKDLPKDKIIGLYLENLLKSGENGDFSNLYNFIESNIVNINEIKNNQSLSLILKNNVNKFQKENNLNAISRLENLDLI